MKLIAFDLETTGLDVDQDRIVQFAFTVVGGEAWTRLVNPGIPISAEATEVHGIEDYHVADLPGFGEHAERVQAIVDQAIESRAIEGSEAALVTFNGRAFDTLMLDAELRRHGEVGLDFKTLREVDVYRLWGEVEPRSLTGASFRFGCPVGPDEQHDAGVDAQLTGDVLASMMDEFGLSFREVLDLSNPEDEVDRLGRLRRDEAGELVFNFGKHEGQRCRDNVGYLQWMRKQSFPRHVWDIIEQDCREKGWK